MKHLALTIAIILTACAWQIRAQTTNNQTDVSKTNSQWSRFTLRGEHEKDVEGVAFNPNGKWLASADNGGKVVLWNLKTQQQEYVFTGKNFSEVAFDPKGILITAAGFDHKVYLWDILSKKPQKQIKTIPITKGHNDEKTDFYFNRNSNSLLVGSPHSNDK